MGIVAEVPLPHPFRNASSEINDHTCLWFKGLLLHWAGCCFSTEQS